MLTVLTELCLCPALEGLMREHTYCDLTDKKVQNQSSPINFLSSALTISGEKTHKLHNWTCYWCLHCMTWKNKVAICLYRLSYAGDIVVPRPEGNESDHQEPGWVLHHAGPCSLGKWTDLWALHHPAAVFPFPSLCIPAILHGWSNESSPLSPGERCAIMGGPRWGVHQAVLPGQGVLEGSHGPIHWPTQQTGARKDLQTAWYTHISQW